MPEQYLAEKNLEEEIEKYLITSGGYLKGTQEDYDVQAALEKETLLTFIKTTQGKEWERYLQIYGDDSERKFIERVNDEINRRGLLKVLRAEPSFKDRGCAFKLVFWKPETDKNPDAAKLYEQNILHCTRQLHYSEKNKNSLDIVLFVNGIPIVSMELKNQFTGQNTGNAVKQYKFDREPKEKLFAFNERVLVHFAVDLYDVKMTTRLEGAKTFFLPFNQGSNGAGVSGGAGNPVSQDGDFVTSYLWKEVLTKDSLLDLLQKYLHLQVNDRGERMIFPRYHQLDVVRKVVADVKARGPGTNYLIQHSAGSGKSNSIAWLAYRLSSLHDANDSKIFQSVIVVTDRKVLDSQLQDNIYQFNHVDGVVEKIDKGSRQLKDAINDEKKIIITTLQKFPFIYDEVTQKNRNFAVIVDEAHSSQTGESAKKLKLALGKTEEEQLALAAEYENKAEDEEPDGQDRLVKELMSHGRRENLSFFAFTATPKPKTLNLFGTPQKDGSFKPFHIYSMRQAIEEGFILDVLQNYMTYQMYYKILKDTPDNPEINAKDGLLKIRQYQSLHPHNIAQKTQIIVEHFREQTKHKIGGRAKAMVVTSSRLHAVRYYLAIQNYCKEKNYTDVDVLVAFSGTVNDNGIEYSEEAFNKRKDTGERIRENQVPREFEENFNILVVAEKYQTGFDQPLLHTMFVDKKLKGVKAVQTLSRLNRTMSGKEDTFVLDFANTAEDIQEAFQPYFEETNLSHEVDPNNLYTIQNQLDEYHVYTPNEVSLFAARFFSSEKTADKALLAELSGILKPAFDRYQALEKEKREEFRSLLTNFVRQYSFITQVFRLFDADLEKFYRYAKFLLKVLPRREREELDLSNKVLMQYYKLEKTFAGSISLAAKGSETFDPPSGGLHKGKEEKETLKELIEKINERFGTNFTNLDLVCVQLCRRFETDEHLKHLARENDSKKIFEDGFNKKFEEAIPEEAETNQDLFDTMMKNPEFMQEVRSVVMNEIYRKFRAAAA